MPVSIQFEWSETPSLLSFEFDAPGLSAKNCDVLLADCYIKVNCPPRLTEIDLKHAVDYNHPKTRCRFTKGKLLIALRKAEEGLWGTFKAQGTKEELKERREASIREANESAHKRDESRASKRLELLKKGESEQWRLDRENRETIENWQKQEKKLAEDEMYESLNEITDKNTPKIVDLDDDNEQGMEEETKTLDVVADSDGIVAPQILPPVRALPSVRKTENFVLPFTRHARPGVPARDLPGRAPPHPRGVAPKPDLPEEMDPVWLKDKGDTFLTQGDYLAAQNAYTEALKEYSNARCFANRAVCALYLGQLGQCIEDCNHALNTLKLRLRVPEGQCPPPQDPEDALVEAAVNIRCGVGNLWLGHLARAVECFDAALKVEGGLSKEEKRIVEEDKERILKASGALEFKTVGDLAVRRAGDSNPPLDAYDEAISTDPDSGVLRANRSFIKLQNGDYDGAIEDGSVALEKLAQWPIARLHPPKLPARPQRLDPPTIEDHTFRPQVRTSEKEPQDWLMKHSGGSTADLPSLPPEYEWIRDASEKSDDAWVAVKKKLTLEVIQAMQRNIRELQDAVFSRKVDVIRDAVTRARAQNCDGVGPSVKAISQAEEYVQKLEDHYRAQEQKHKEDEDQYTEEMANQGRHTAKHSVEKTRRRLYVKVKLRRAAAYEGLSTCADVHDGAAHKAAAIKELTDALAFEPTNADALERMKHLQASIDDRVVGVDSVCVPEDNGTDDRPTGGNGGSTAASFVDITTLPAAQNTYNEVDRRVQAYRESESIMSHEENDDNDEDGAADCEALLESARAYIRKEDFAGAFQVLSYALKKDTFRDTREKVKCMVNACLCLQKMRGRVEDLVGLCSRTLDVIAELQSEDPSILRMECACYSRRGWGYTQMGRTQQAERDAEKVQYLLQRVTA